MIDLGLSGKRAIVSGAGYIPERAGHGRFTALAERITGQTLVVDGGATIHSLWGLDVERFKQFSEVDFDAATQATGQSS